MGDTVKLSVPDARGAGSEHRRKRQSGQAVVELALAAPVLLMLVFGVIDGGRAINAWIILQNAAREGAFYAAKTPSATTTDVTAVVRNEAAPLLNGSGVGVTATLNVTGPYTVDGAEEKSSWVIVTYSFPFVTPFAFGHTMTMTAEAAAPEGP